MHSTASVFQHVFSALHGIAQKLSLKVWRDTTDILRQITVLPSQAICNKCPWIAQEVHWAYWLKHQIFRHQKGGLTLCEYSKSVDAADEVLDWRVDSCVKPHFRLSTLRHRMVCPLCHCGCTQDGSHLVATTKLADVSNEPLVQALSLSKKRHRPHSQTAYKRANLPLLVFDRMTDTRGGVRKTRKLTKAKTNHSNGDNDEPIDRKSYSPLVLAPPPAI